jgi:hypothetical protein
MTHSIVPEGAATAQRLAALEAELRAQRADRLADEALRPEAEAEIERALVQAERDLLIGAAFSSGYLIR